jgi:CheY-like chemotaxis protein
MQTLQSKTQPSIAAAARDARVTVFVDCADPARQDVLVYWLTRGGYRVHDGPLPASPVPAIEQEDGSVLLTDRFGPGLDGGVTIFQRKAQRPGLRVVVIGSGDASELAQLSLARAAGADATVSARMDRDELFRLLSPWA